MKKVLLAIAVIALIGCASCSKTKTCKCSYSVAGFSYTTEAAEYEVRSCSDITTVAGVPSGIEFHCFDAN